MHTVTARPDRTLADCRTNIRWPGIDRMPALAARSVDLHVHRSGHVTVLPPGAPAGDMCAAVVQVRTAGPLASALAELAAYYSTIADLVRADGRATVAASMLLRPPAPRRTHADIGRCVAVRPYPSLRPQVA